MSRFLRRLSNPFAPRTPPRANYQSEDLSPQVKDAVFEWQLGSDDFSRLDDETLLRAGICSTSTHARQILRAAHKIGLIDPTSGRPNAASINSGMLKAMPSLAITRQRELVMLLFFWEEEIARWTSFSSQEDEIEQRLKERELGEGLKAELRCLLGAAKANRRVVPSLRDTYGQEDQLPAYSEHPA